uniref:Uncharacterized protein n=1 Tax=Klebsiella pneumoniae TaxID=573 RepID=A0A8B0SUP0_KLEPN|nr:hypothetical protein [Klebsiella pneumoniae]
MHASPEGFFPDREVPIITTIRLVSFFLKKITQHLIETFFSF